MYYNSEINFCCLTKFSTEGQHHQKHFAMRQLESNGTCVACL